MARNLREIITTGQLLARLRSASSFGEVAGLQKDAEGPRFHEVLFELMSDKGLSAKNMIRMTGIERAYFYHLLSGKKQPGRNVVLRIGLCLGLPLQEMNRLLRLAGVSELYARRSRDAALIFAVTHQYDMEQANSLLTDAGEEPLYS